MTEKRDEAYISTFKPCAQTAPRFSRAHGYQSWP